MELPKPAMFEWDKGNLDKNWEKHRINYKEIEEVFINKPIKIYRDVKHSQAEQRFTALGVTNSMRELYLTFTIRDFKIRIISARDQSRKERRVYEEN